MNIFVDEAVVEPAVNPIDETVSEHNERDRRRTDHPPTYNKHNVVIIQVFSFKFYSSIDYISH